MIKAIETSYAGCRFRSRLEARWAVFLDQLGISWQYEHQGLLCTHRLTHDDGEFPYLPDFWFPDLGLHGEVKGALTHPELTRLLNAAASLSSNNGYGCHDDGGHDLVIFGNIPAPAENTEGHLPTRLHMHKGSLEASGWALSSLHPVSGTTIAIDSGGDPGIYEIPPAAAIQWLTRGSWASSYTNWASYELFARAYDAARRARFEHGQHGA